MVAKASLAFLSLLLVLVSACRSTPPEPSTAPGSVPPAPVAPVVAPSVAPQSSTGISAPAPPAPAAPVGGNPSGASAGRPADPAPSLPTATPVPSPTAVPTSAPPTTTPPRPTPAPPTPTPAARLRPLTDGGCCVSPSWLPDSRRVVFIDRPTGGQTGLYAVDVDADAPPTFFAPELGYYAAGMSIRWEPVGETVRIERLIDGRKFTLNNGGRSISVSPDGRRVGWQVTPTQTGVPLEQRVTQIWIANSDGSDIRQVASLLRGGLSAWFPDGDRLLVSGRPDPKSQVQSLSVLDIASGRVTEVVRTERLRGGSVSPGGGWVFFSVAFHPDLAQNGLWLVRADGSDRRKLDFYGAVQWWSEGKLLYIPLEVDAKHHAFWEYDAATGRSRQVVDPKQTPIKISNGDWALSPDGRRVVFVSAADRNLWLLELAAPS